jgi:hypothetical protein
MPCIAPDACSRILERLELQAGGGQTNNAAIFDQAFAIARDKVCHGATLPNMAMEPEPSIHRVDHPLASKCKLTIGTTVERAVAIYRSAAHCRAAAMNGSVAGNTPLER